MQIRHKSGVIEHTNVDPDTLQKVKLTTRYQIGEAGHVIHINSTTDEGETYPRRKVSLVDLKQFIEESELI